MRDIIGLSLTAGALGFAVYMLVVRSRRQRRLHEQFKASGGLARPRDPSEPRAWHETWLGDVAHGIVFGLIASALGAILHRIFTGGH